MNQLTNIFHCSNIQDPWTSSQVGGRIYLPSLHTSPPTIGCSLMIRLGRQQSLRLLYPRLRPAFAVLVSSCQGWYSDTPWWCRLREWRVLRRICRVLMDLRIYGFFRSLGFSFTVARERHEFPKPLCTLWIHMAASFRSVTLHRPSSLYCWAFANEICVFKSSADAFWLCATVKPLLPKPLNQRYIYIYIFILRSLLLSINATPHFLWKNPVQPYVPVSLS